MSEDLVSNPIYQLGRYSYIRLGGTTLNQLKKNKIIKGRLPQAQKHRKPDGVIFLRRGGVKAIVELKPTKEISTKKKLQKVIQDYLPIAKATCNLLIVTDCKNTYWVNAHTGNFVLDENGNPINLVFDTKTIQSGKLPDHSAREISAVIDRANASLSESTDQLGQPALLDPTELARSVWQKIWISTGKDPEKCLYNVVEIFVFKFLSDIGVLRNNYAFQNVLELAFTHGGEDSLKHYAKLCRPEIRKLFPPSSDDGTTIINGTIFVNEQGDPNLAQADLFKEVLIAFNDYEDANGSMRYIQREFKTRLYEVFLRQEPGIKFMGQYFTPRNVVRAIVDMSPMSSLGDGAKVCDPFCGVGGFILEAIASSTPIFKQFEPDEEGKIRPRIAFTGYDKGTDEKDDERTIILAKANMLIYFSDLLACYNSESYLKEFSESVLNKVFRLIRSNLGTFGIVDAEQYDLILTNPPYVVSGTGILKGALKDENLQAIYSHGGRGTQALAIQWIVHHLKPNGTAIVVVPDGLLLQKQMLDFMREHCEIQGIISLPTRTFYSTVQKTYILIIKKKDDPSSEQDTPTFAYLVSEIGESRDARRRPIDQNDLNEAVSLFNQFKGSPKTFTSTSKRCKIVDSEWVANNRHWLIDKLWSSSELAALGIEDSHDEVDLDGLKTLVAEATQTLERLLKDMEEDED